MPFHKAQLALNGFDEDQVKEAGWVVNAVAGSSAYMYGTGYDKDRFMEEVGEMVEHIRKHAAEK